VKIHSQKDGTPENMQEGLQDKGTSLHSQGDSLKDLDSPPDSTRFLVQSSQDRILRGGTGPKEKPPDGETEKDFFPGWREDSF
jgi:hypothetical protein